MNEEQFMEFFKGIPTATVTRAFNWFTRPNVNWYGCSKKHMAWRYVRRNDPTQGMQCLQNLDLDKVKEKALEFQK